MNFSSFSFDARLQACIDAEGYDAPTPIQQEAIPMVLDGRDLLGIAQTGTGKTAAFVLPILQRLLGGERGRIRALIVAPTRELAVQIDEVIRTFAARTGIVSTCVFGGVSFGGQLRQLRRGVDIVVGCPGRLLDHLGQGTIDFSALQVVVLDEADQMLDMGFLPAVRQLMKALPRERQTLLFSATMPEAIRGLSDSILRNPATVRIGRRTPPATIEHAVYPVPAHLKTPLLLELMKDIEGSVLVFTRTKHRAKRLGEQLSRIGYRAASLQGNLSQNRRQEAMAGFRSGKYQVLVATDIAARGIDVSTISHVINYDIPDTPETYTHRIGRTARAARTGDAFTLVTQEDASMLRSIERALGTRIDRRELANFDYRASGPDSSKDDTRMRASTGRSQRPSQNSRRPRNASGRPGGFGRRPRRSDSRSYAGNV